MNVMSMFDLSGKVAVITGSSKGIGKAIAQAMAAHGARVVISSRKLEPCEEVAAGIRANGGKAVAIAANISRREELENLIAETRKQLGPIDALICNAAIAQVPRRQLTVDGFESQLGTNHFGHFLLCGLLFDRIEASGGRIVVVASLGYKMGLRRIKFEDLSWEQNYGANTAYSQSKLAQMMFAYELQDRLAAAGRKGAVYVCHPGSSATSLIRTSGGLLTRFTWWLMTKTPMVQTAEQGGYPEVMCATETGLEQRALYGPTGRMEFVGPVGRGTLQAHAHDKAAMTRLWQVSEQATGFTWQV